MAAWDAEFEAFASSRSRALLRSAYLLCGNSTTAEDLVQTALSRLYTAWPRLHRRGELDAYARATVVRVFIDETRRPWRREHPSAQVPETNDEGHADEVVSRAAVMEALRALPARQRAVVVLRVWEDLSVEQTAAALNVSKGTVKSQLAKALERLRQDPAIALTDEAERQRTYD